MTGETSRFELSMDGPFGEVKVDGHELTEVVAVRFDLKARELPTVTLDLLPFESLIAADTEVMISVPLPLALVRRFSGADWTGSQDAVELADFFRAALAEAKQDER